MMTDLRRPYKGSEKGNMWGSWRRAIIREYCRYEGYRKMGKGVERICPKKEKHRLLRLSGKMREEGGSEFFLIFVKT